MSICTRLILLTHSDSELGAVTQWLAQHGDGDSSAVNNQLFAMLYQELRRQARAQLRKEDASHTLSATALAHEAWFRLSEQSRVAWRNRSHFLATSALMMRRILVNHALAKRAERRDAGERVVLETGQLHELAQPADQDVVAVHEALNALEAVDARAAQVVTLRHFGGLENEEVAEVLGTSLATVKRDWSFARAWLQRELASR